MKGMQKVIFASESRSKLEPYQTQRSLNEGVARFLWEKILIRHLIILVFFQFFPKEACDLNKGNYTQGKETIRLSGVY